MNDMHPEDIKAAIRKRGMTLAMLAEANDMSKQNLTLALHARVSERAERIVAHFLEKTPGAIWPSRYDEDGNRLALRRARSARKVAA